MTRSMSGTATRRLRLGLAVPALVGIATACGSGEPRSGGAEGAGFDAEAALSAWVDLWATYDLARVDDLFLDDRRLTYFSSEKEGLMVGPGAIREHHAGFDFVEGGRAPAQELWVDRIHVSEFGAVAVVSATWHFGDRDEPEAASRGPMTVVYVDEGHGPRIAHMHFADY